MMKKILSILIIPALVIGVFVGCGKDHTLSDVKRYYEAMVNKYNYEISGDALQSEGNDYFKVYFDNQENKYKIGTSMHISYYGELGTGLSNIAGNSGLKESDNELYNRYFALINIEQKILDWTYNYYTKWNSNLYASNDLIKDKIDQDDIENMYEKLEKLDEVLAEFASEKNKAQDEINAISFEGAINLTSFTYSYNDLIEASFDFVNAFKDFHVKYIWDTYTFGESEESNKLLLDRLIDEAYLNMAQVIYYENVKVFEYSECDLNDLINKCEEKSDYIYAQLLYTTSKETTYNGCEVVLKNSQADNSMYSSEDLVLKAEYKTDKDGKKIAETYNDRLSNYIYYLKAFNQKISIYKNVYDDFDMYKYNQVRLGLSPVDYTEYVNSLDRIDKANLILLQNFADETFVNYVNSFVKIFNN